jgi:TonB-linked SusC/RagA family outer membrane protein
MKLQIKRVSMALLLSSACFVTYAQKTITGTVKDATGEPMIGVSVVVDGTSIGGVTDFNGNFSITKAPDNAVLKVSYVGYKDQKITTAGKNTLKITLQEDAQGLDEIVVVGYGVQKKKDLTGSVASIKTEDLQKVAAANVMQAMQAKVPGLDLQQSSGEAGAGVSMTLRGNRSITASNSPLIIVDGVEYGSTMDIPANDIESMDVLKDASSTAIYGTKGANGVIIITTKRGKAGKTRVDFNAYVSFNSPTSAVKGLYGNSEVSLWKARADYQADYTAYTAAVAAGNTDANAIWGTSNKTLEEIFGSTTIAGNDNILVTDLINEGSFTDWYDTFLRNSTSRNYELSVGGGGDKTNFNFSLAAMYDEGLLKNDKMSRYNGRLNIDHIINKIVKVGANMAFTYKSHDARNSAIFNAARKMTSLTHAYNSDGTIIEKPNVWYDAHVNPLMDEGDAYQNNVETTRFLGSAYGQLTPIKGLVLKSQFAVDRTNSRTGTYNDYHSVNRYQSPTTTYISNVQAISTRIDWQNTANYAISFNKIHDLNVLLGHELQQTVDESLGVNGTAGQQHLYNSSFYDVTKISSDSKMNSGYTKQSLLSFFGRLNYTLMDKYLLSASLRADGSSVLAEGHKWGYFPAVSAGWRISEESFMANTKSWLDNLKLRIAWGKSGNAAIDPYQTLATVAAVTTGSATNFIPKSMSNSDLTWEKTGSTNLGLDFSFLNSRISGSIDLYWTKTTDLLYYKSAPASSIFTSVLANVGETKGNGIEIALNASPIRTKQFSWDINATYTHAHDEVVKLADGLTFNMGNGHEALMVGEPVSMFYDYETNGCWGVGEYAQYVATMKDQGITVVAPITGYGTPGTLKIVDQNNDGVIDATNDRRVYQRSPNHIFGLTNTFTYQEWSLSVQCMARLGGYMQFDKNNAIGLNDGNANWADVDYWTPTNQAAKFPSPGSTANASIYTTYGSALLWEKADYFKIKDITLAYSLPKKWMSKAFISNAKIYCSMKNYITFSKVKDYDAERGGSVNFPLSKQIVLGVNVSF